MCAIRFLEKIFIIALNIIFQDSLINETDFVCHRIADWNRTTYRIRSLFPSCKETIPTFVYSCIHRWIPLSQRKPVQSESYFKKAIQRIFL